MLKVFLKKTLFPLVANSLSTKTCVGLLKQPVIHPFYHTLADRYLPHIHPLYNPLTTNEFEAHVDFLLTHFHPVRLQQVRELQSGQGRLEKVAFHLSFDDGLRGVYELAMPILARKGVPCTVFVNSAFVDNKDLFFRHKAALLTDKLRKDTVSEGGKKEIRKRLQALGIVDTNLPQAMRQIPYAARSTLDRIAELAGIDFSSFLQTQQPYLTTDELLAIQDAGHSIGAHSIDHPYYSELPLSEQLRQTRESIRFISGVNKDAPACFAFPFTDENLSDAFFSHIKDDVALTFGIGGIYARREGRHLGRIDMELYGKTARECIHKAALKSRFLSSHTA